MDTAEYCKEMREFFVAQIMGENQKEHHKDVSMNKKALQTIETILKRGKGVEVRRKGDGYIVLFLYWMKTRKPLEIQEEPGSY